MIIHTSKFKIMTLRLIKTGLIAPGIFIASLFFPGEIYALVTDAAPQKSAVNIEPKQSYSAKETKLIVQNNQPNRDRFLQPDLEQINPQDRELEPILPKPEPLIIPESESEGDNIEFYIRKINVTGSTVFTDQELEELTAPLRFKRVKLSELRNLAKDITKKYLSQGYISTRAIVPQQEIELGVVEIKIIEGSIGELKIEGNNRLRESFIRDRLELGINTPIKVDSLEGQLQLLRSNQGIENIEANLQPAPGEGKSSLIVKVEENNPWFYSLEVNNYSTVATGAERVNAALGYRNLTGNSDTVVASFEQALDADSWSANASYNLPVNAKDGTVQLRADINRNEIVVDDFDDLNLEGDSELYEISFRQPLTRTLKKEFALSIGFSFQESRDFFNGVSLNQTNRTNVIKLGQDLTTRDVNGVWALRSQFNIGVDTSDEPDAADILNQNLDQPDDIFISWLGQTQRLQRISPNNLLIFQGDIQLTPNNLSPSEQFVIGGQRSVRGYRQNARLGESGFRLSIEDRITVARNSEDNPLLQIAPFADMGVVFSASAEDPEDNFLVGVGLGIIAEPISGLNLRLDYAPPLINLDDRDNIQEDGFYFSLGYRN